MSGEREGTVYDEAQKRGLEVVAPGPKDVFVDLDQAGDLFVLEALLPLLDQHAGAKLVVVTRSEHGGRHAYIQVERDLTETERLLLQACLGSDRKRELLGLLRVWGLRPDMGPVTVLFEEGAQAVKARAALEMMELGA